MTRTRTWVIVFAGLCPIQLNDHPINQIHSRRVRFELTIEVPKTSVFPVTPSPCISCCDRFFLLLFPLFSEPLSKSSTCIANLVKGQLSSTRCASNSESVWVFTDTRHITHPLSTPHKPCPIMSQGVGMILFDSLIGGNFFARQSFLFGLLLLLFENTHLVGSRHDCKEE